MGKKKQEKKSKDKHAAKRKKFSTDDEKFSPPSDKKKLLELEVDPHKWLLEKDEKKLPYQMCGAKVYALNDDFYREVKENIGRKFEVGEKVKGRRDSYKVIQVLGRRTYLLKSLTSGNECVMKVEATILPTNGPILIRESFFASNALKDLNSYQRSHFLKYIDRHKITSDKYDSFSGVMMAKAKIPLSEIRAKKLNGNEFSTQTAIRLCMMTLQCIHDVHRNRYVHRDIQPKNFFVGAPDKNGVSSIMITGFAYCYDILRRDFLQTGICSTRILGNTRFLNSVFQPRPYHIRDDIVTFYDDLESWIFMCYDIFNSKALPWNQSKKLSERDIFSQKEAFFVGAFDNHFNALEIPVLLHYIRRRIYLLKKGEPVDYPFLAFMITKLGKENNVVWTEKFEWQDNKESKRNSIAETQDENETGTGESAPSSTHEEPPLAKAKKPGKKAKLTQPKSIDMDEEELKPVRLQSKPSEDDQKLKPVAAVTPKKKAAKKMENEDLTGEETVDIAPSTHEKPPPAKKPNKRLTEPQSIDMDEEAFKPVRLQAKPPKPTAVKKPAKENQEANPVGDELPPKPAVITPKKLTEKPKVENQEVKADPVVDELPPKPAAVTPEKKMENQEANPAGDELIIKPPAAVSIPSDKKVDNQGGEANCARDESLSKPAAVVSKPTSDKKVVNQKEANPVVVIPEKKPAKLNEDQEEESEGEKNSEGSDSSPSKPNVSKPASSDKKTSGEKEDNEKKTTGNAVNEQEPPPLNVAKPSEPPQAKKPEEFNVKSDYFQLPK